MNEVRVPHSSQGPAKVGRGDGVIWGQDRRDLYPPCRAAPRRAAHSSAANTAAAQVHGANALLKHLL
jgi:hypothetical protein